jgi:hypothetical protein
MKHALIRGNNDPRVYDVVEQTFAVAEPFRWVDCPDGTLAGQHTFNGSGFDAADTTPGVPQSVSRAQAKIALHRAGLLDLVKTAVAADPEVQIWFDDATTWERQNPHVVALGDQLIGDAAGVDALFVQAAQIAA